MTNKTLFQKELSVTPIFALVNLRDVTLGTEIQRTHGIQLGLYVWNVNWIFFCTALLCSNVCSLSKVVDGCGACHVLSSFPNSDSDSTVSLDRTRLGATDLMRSGKFQSLQPRTGVPSSTSQGTETAELGYRANSSNS